MSTTLLQAYGFRVISTQMLSSTLDCDIEKMERCVFLITVPLQLGHGDYSANSHGVSE